MISRELPSARLSVPAVAAVAVLGLAVLSGTVIGSGQAAARPLNEASLIVGAAIVLLVSLSRLGLGVALVPVVAAAVPFELSTGTDSPIVAGLMFVALLLGVWLLRALAGRDLRIVRSPVVVPCIGLVVVWIFAFLYSDVDVSPSVWNWDRFTLPRLGGLAVVLLSIGALLLALNVGRNRRWIRLATWSFLGLSVVGIVGIYLDDPAFGFLATGGLFTMWAVALAYGQALFNERLSRLARAGLLALTVAWLFQAIVLETIWFSGWVPSVIALAVITFFRSKRTFAMLVLGVAIAVALNWGRVYQALWTAKIQEGDYNRPSVWQQALQVAEQHPLLGTGPAGYMAYYRSVYANSPFSSLSSHSNYVDVVAETGIVGTAVFAWFMVSLLVVGWRAHRRWRSSFEGGFAQATLGGLLGLMVAMALGDWFIPFVYNQTIAGFRYTVQSWIFLGFLASLAAVQGDFEDDVDGSLDRRRQLEYPGAPAQLSHVD